MGILANGAQSGVCSFASVEVGFYGSCSCSSSLCCLIVLSLLFPSPLWSYRLDWSGGRGGSCMRGDCVRTACAGAQLAAADWRGGRQHIRNFWRGAVLPGAAVGSVESVDLCGATDFCAAVDDICWSSGRGQ